MRTEARPWSDIPADIRERSAIANLECDASDGHSCSCFGPPVPGCDCAIRTEAFRAAVKVLRDAAPGPSVLAELTIRAKPQSKKTSQRVAGNIPRPSSVYRLFEDKALWLLKSQYRGPAIVVPCTVTAMFHRDNRADVDNLGSGLLDVLQKAKIIKNDRLVMKFITEKSGKCDGDPRVVVRIEPYRSAP